MSEKDSEAFEFSFDPDLDAEDDFDPMESLDVEEDVPEDEDEELIDGIFKENKEGRTEFLPPDADRVPVITDAVDQSSEEYAARPAEERLRQLFSQLKAQRRIVLQIVESASQPISTDEMEEAVKDVRTKKFSVYSTANLCSMLETAGGLERVMEDGSPYVAKKMEPDIVVEDGEEYYVPTEPPKAYWLATDAARTVAAERQGTESELEALFEKESDFLSIHKRVLTMASRENGATMAEFSAAIDSNPLIAKPRRFFVQHFVEELEHCDAVEWGGQSWVITDLGRRGLKLLEGVDDSFESGVKPVKGKVAAMTQGVNW